MAKNNNLKDYLIDLYQGIASRKPNASKNPQDFRSEIENLVFTSDANAAASDIRAGKTAYVNDVKVTGTIEDYDESIEEHALPTKPYDILANGTYDVSYYTSVNVNIPDLTSKINNTLREYKTDQYLDINDYAFYESTIQTIDCYVNSINSRSFTKSYAFNLVFRNNTVTPIDSSYLPYHFKIRGCLFVPDDLVNTYKNESACSSYKDRIFPLSTYDAGIPIYLDATYKNFITDNSHAKVIHPGWFELYAPESTIASLITMRIYVPEKSSHQFTITMSNAGNAGGIYQIDSNNTYAIRSQGTEEFSYTFTDVPTGEHTVTCSAKTLVSSTNIRRVIVYFKAL